MFGAVTRKSTEQWEQLLTPLLNELVKNRVFVTTWTKKAISLWDDKELSSLKDLETKEFWSIIKHYALSYSRVQTVPFLQTKITLITPIYLKSPFLSQKNSAASPLKFHISTWHRTSISAPQPTYSNKNFGPHCLLITRYKYLIPKNYILNICFHHMFSEYILITYNIKDLIFNTSSPSTITSLDFQNITCTISP